MGFKGPNSGPCVLITGFSVFPGAPVNPTQELISWLQQSFKSAHPARFRYAVLETHYRGIRQVIADLTPDRQPDIVVHFGLAAQARGFRLERSAQNIVSTQKPDQRGEMPLKPTITPGQGNMDSTLPLGAIAENLTAAGLPMEFSSDAGDYVCNYIFHLSLLGQAPNYKPGMVGFIHVPYLDTQLPSLGPAGVPEPASCLTEDQLFTGAAAIIDTCVSAWCSAYQSSNRLS